MSLTAEQCDEFWSIADKNGDGELTVHELAAAIKLYQPSHPGKNYRPPTQKDIAVSKSVKTHTCAHTCSRTHNCVCVCFHNVISPAVSGIEPGHH